jgi:hypothetical protein
MKRWSAVVKEFMSRMRRTNEQPEEIVQIPEPITAPSPKLAINLGSISPEVLYLIIFWVIGVFIWGWLWNTVEQRLNPPHL